MARRTRVKLEVVTDEQIGDVLLKGTTGKNPVLTTKESATDYTCGTCDDIVVRGAPGPPVVIPGSGRLLFECQKCRSKNLFPL